MGEARNGLLHNHPNPPPTQFIQRHVQSAGRNKINKKSMTLNTITPHNMVHQSLMISLAPVSTASVPASNEHNRQFSLSSQVQHDYNYHFSLSVHEKKACLKYTEKHAYYFYQAFKKSFCSTPGKMLAQILSS